MQADLKTATEFIKGRLYLLSVRSVASLSHSSDVHFITVDEKHVYEAFYRDFGPVHLGHTVVFCRHLRKIMNDPLYDNKKIVVVTSHDGHKRANAAYLVCAFMLICQGQTPEDAFKPFNNAYPPFIPFRDASQCMCHIIHCIIQ
jgi:cell division cycle 14